jgi:nucleoside-diphosphate-sugar epimerase
MDRGLSVRIGDVCRSEAWPDLWTECNVRDAATLRSIVAGAGTIVNLAAEHRDDVRPISSYYDTNVRGAEQVCQAARDARVMKIIFTSSVAVYGFHPQPLDESGPFQPVNPYGETKLAAEAVYQAWAAEDASRTLVMIRPAVVFGEKNRGNVYNLLRQIASGRFLMVGSGNNMKSMAYVGNVAAFLAHTLSLAPGLHIFNYVDGPDMNTSDLVKHVWHCLGKSGQPRRIPKSEALAGGTAFDIVARITGRRFPISAVRVRKFCESTQFRADRIASTGFRPPYSLAEGLARTLESEFGTRAPSDGQG